MILRRAADLRAGDIVRLHASGEDHARTWEVVDVLLRSDGVWLRMHAPQDVMRAQMLSFQPDDLVVVLTP